MQDTTIPAGTQAVSAMLSHAARYSPYYREQQWASRLRAGREVSFQEIPITPKTLVRDQTEQFYGSFVPPSEGKVHVKHTSGSSGEPMQVLKTQRHFQINLTENRRHMDAWGFSSHRRVAHILFPDLEHPVGRLEERSLPGGGQQWDLSTLNTGDALDLFRRTAASLVLAFPSIMLGVLERCAELGQALPIRLISTVSEVVPDELRRYARQIPNCRLMDIYGCVEAGLIAVQCPQCDAYHPADRHLILEFITDSGRPAGPGELGRVIITPLFNRAMPLIRYETGDYAVLAGNKGCPYSPRAIARIVGREKNLFKLPDGEKVAAMLPSGIAHHLGVRQFKLFQTSYAEVELHYVPRAGDAEIEEAAAQTIVNRYLSPRFRVHCRRVSEIPRLPSGKYIMHECLI